MALWRLPSAVERMDLPFVEVERIGFTERETESDLSCAECEMIFLASGDSE